MTIELLEGPVENPGYYRLPESEYHGDPAPKPSVSSSVLTTLIKKTAKDAWYQHPRLNPEYEAEDKTSYDLGSVAHALLLGKGPEIVVIDENDWRKKATQDARDRALADGMQPCLKKVYDQADAMATAAREQLADDKDNHMAFTNGHAEVSCLWREEVLDGVRMWCRSRIDWLMDDLSCIYDYKTWGGGTDPDDFIKYLARESRDIQAPMYQAGIAAIEDIDWDGIPWRWVVQDPNPPYVLMVCEMHPEDQEWSYERYKWALEQWAKSGMAGKWAGRTPRTHLMQVPPYARTDWEAKKQLTQASEELLADEEE